METLTFILSIIGAVAFSLSGAMLGIRKGLDLLGVLVVGTITAVGGGVLRDILLGILPPTMFSDPIYAFAAVLSAFLLFLILYFSHPSIPALDARMSKIINVFDAIGLGIFCVVGTEVSMNAGYSDNSFLCIFLGVITGAGGGVIRDLLVGDIPMILRKHIYAVAAFLGSALYYISVRIEVPSPSCTLICVVVVIVIRLLAAHYKWNLPRIQQPPDKL